MAVVSFPRRRSTSANSNISSPSSQRLLTPWSNDWHDLMNRIQVLALTKPAEARLMSQWVNQFLKVNGV